MPPSTCKVCPVMYDDISEARKIQALATSSGEPPLFRGIAFRHSSTVF